VQFLLPIIGQVIVAHAPLGEQVAWQLHELAHDRLPHAPVPLQLSTHLPVPQVSFPQASFPFVVVQPTVQVPMPHVMLPHALPTSHVMLHDAAPVHVIVSHEPELAQSIVQFQPVGHVTALPWP
jgi:hypothetical protein